MTFPSVFFGDFFAWKMLATHLVRLPTVSESTFQLHRNPEPCAVAQSLSCSWEKKNQSHQSLGLRMIDMTLKQLLNGMNYNFYKTPRTKRLDHEIIPFKTAKDYNCKVFVFHVPSGSSLGRDKLFAPLSQYKHLVFGDWL